MDYDLHKKYEEVSLNPQLREMFWEIISADEALRKVFKFISKKTVNTTSPGITIKDIITSVEIERRVQSVSRKNFELTKGLIDRKHAERVVDRLLAMGLCYYIAVPPSKLVNLTKRGKEVINEFVKRDKGENN